MSPLGDSEANAMAQARIARVAQHLAVRTSSVVLEALNCQARPMSSFANVPEVGCWAWGRPGSTPGPASTSARAPIPQRRVTWNAGFLVYAVPVSSRI